MILSSDIPEQNFFRMKCFLLTISISFCPGWSQRMDNKLLEIRSYNLKPGPRDQFHKVMTKEALPMLQAVNMQVIVYGPSSHDENSYFLMRLFNDAEDRQTQEDAFYGSTEWLRGPREKVLSFIEDYTTITIPASERLIQGLRSNQPPI
jgi:NIPSNAP